MSTYKALLVYKQLLEDIHWSRAYLTHILVDMRNLERKRFKTIKNPKKRVLFINEKDYRRLARRLTIYYFVERMKVKPKEFKEIFGISLNVIYNDIRAVQFIFNNRLLKLDLETSLPTVKELFKEVFPTPEG